MRIDPNSQSTNVQDTIDLVDSENSPVKSHDKSGISRKRPLSSEDTASRKHFKPSLVEAEFFDMKRKLQIILQTCDTDKVFKECKSLLASDTQNIPLFSNEEYLQSLKECNLVPAILQKLSPFFKWSDHSVLSAVVKACNNPEAMMLLQQFDAQGDFSLPVTEYPVPQPVPAMAPYGTSTQTVLGVKLNSDLNQFSLHQVLELRCLIQKTFQITEHSLQLMAAKSSSTILYWMIPKCVSHLINSKIMKDASLHVGKVEEISVYPGTLFISASNLKLGSLSFLNQVSEMVC